MDGSPGAARSVSGPGAQAGAGSVAATVCLATLVLLVGGLAGGGRGGLGDTLAQLIAISLLIWLCVLQAFGRLAWHAPLWVRCLPVLALALPLFQLMPVPETVGVVGPARSELALQMARAGIEFPRTISLNPVATEAALWSLLPASAMFLSALAIPKGGRIILLVVTLALALANVGVGMAQVAGGVESPLRLYAHTNLDQAVGFFANRNHLACLLVMCLPIALAAIGWSVAKRSHRPTVSPLLVIGACGLVVMLMLGIVLTRSRAGVLLGMLAVLGSLPIVLSLGPKRGARRILAITIAFAVMLAMQFSLLGVVDRMDVSSLDDGRLRYTTTTLSAARAYAPFGSGLGTFRHAYAPFEAKVGEPTRYIVNHAHDDYVELLLEGGIVALVLLVAAGWIWIRRGARIVLGARGQMNEPARLLLARACWWGATLGLLHSALDYPLRTTANMCIFALLVAISFSEAAHPRTRRG